MLCPRLIGRDDEWRTIQAALDAARNARGSGVFLIGEAGVGKSRLAREAERLARSTNMCVLWGRSVDGGAVLAFRPITEALMSVLRHDAAILADRPELRPFIPILTRLIPDLREDGGVPTSADDSLVLLSEAVLRLLRALGTSRGCLLVLEDLQWADTETLVVLEYLIANSTAEALLVLATSRPETSSAAVGLARSLAAHRGGTVMELPRLPPPAVRDMASACLDNAPVPETVERLLSTSAEGLPLLVEDLLAEWIGAGALVQLQNVDAWEVRQVIGPIVPMSFAETVRRRLHMVGAECARLLVWAALLGRHFEWTLLPSASGLDEERVLEHLHAAVDAQLLLADPLGFRFRHALTRQAVLDELTPVQRARHAGRLLELVEAAHPQLDGEWSELAAALADTAGDRSRAATLLLEAGRKSLAQGALVTAEATLERAETLAPTTEVRAEVVETLLQVLSEAGQTERVFEVGEALLDTLAGGAAASLRAAHVHLSIAQAAVAGARLEEATQHLDQALQLDVSGELEARIGAQKAHVAIDQLRVDAAARLARAALDVAERVGEMDVACEALLVLGRLARTRDLDGAEAAFTSAHQLAEAHGLTVWRCRALHELGTVDMFREWSTRRLLQARTLSEESGALATVAAVDIELAAVYAVRFELERSMQAAQRAWQAGRRFRLRGVECTALLFIAELHGLRQDRAAMERLLAELPKVTGEEALYFGMCRNAFRAEASLCEDDRQQALRDLVAAVNFGRSLPAAAPSPSFGEWVLLWTLEHPEGSAAEAQAQAPPEWAMVQPINRAFVEYARAIELGRNGHRTEAAEAVAQGDRILANAPWYFHMGRRLVAEAAVRNGWGDPAGWLSEGEAFFDQHGYHAVVSACRSLLRRCGVRSSIGRGHAGVPEPFKGQGVTEREMEVLAALPDGLSNKEIAVRLYLSPKTVEKHVASLMDKLEVRSRAQLAALASTKMGDAARSNWGKSRL